MKRHWFPGWVIPILVIFATGTVWLRLAVVRTAYSLNQSDRVLTNLRRERDKMEVEVTGLRSPRRLEILSKSKFHLTRPKAGQVVYLK